MTYTYRCECGKTVEIDKPMSEASKQEKCKCGEILQRVYTTVGIKTNDGVKVG